MRNSKVKFAIKNVKYVPITNLHNETIIEMETK